MDVRLNVDLSDHTTLKLGGPAKFFVSVTSLPELQEACKWAHDKSLPIFILGEGSNVLFPDEGWNGLVIQIALRGIEYTKKDLHVYAVVGAGENWDAFVGDTVERGLWGIENLSGIPGSVGATPAQNVGAYGVEIKDVLEWVEVYDPVENSSQRLSNKECLFSYRDSVFKTPQGKNFVISKVCFLLSTKAKPMLAYADVKAYFSNQNNKTPSQKDIRHAILEIRKKKFPDIREIGTAGSFFKNPIVKNEKAKELKKRFPDMPMYPAESGATKLSLAWMLDHVLSLKGTREGNIGTFVNQPLVLVHYGGASSEELCIFAKNIQKQVQNELKIDIVPEVTIVGNKK